MKPRVSAFVLAAVIATIFFFVSRDSDLPQIVEQESVARAETGDEDRLRNLSVEQESASSRWTGERLVADEKSSSAVLADEPDGASAANPESDLMALTKLLVSEDFDDSLTLQQRETFVRRFGSVKAYRLNRLRSINPDAFDDWLDQTYQDGLDDQESVERNTDIMDPVIAAIFDSSEPLFFECSSDVCILETSVDQVGSLTTRLGTGEIEMPSDFVRTFSADRVSPNSFRTYLIREDIDVSDYPGS